MTETLGEETVPGRRVSKQAYRRQRASWARRQRYDLLTLDGVSSVKDQRLPAPGFFFFLHVTYNSISCPSETLMALFMCKRKGEEEERRRRRRKRGRKEEKEEEEKRLMPQIFQMLPRALEPFAFQDSGSPGLHAILDCDTPLDCLTSLDLEDSLGRKAFQVI